jgi:copper chaperone CopZ
VEEQARVTFDQNKAELSQMKEAVEKAGYKTEEQ